MITAAVQGAAADGEMMTSYYRDDITGLPEMGVVAEKLWRDSGLKPCRHPDRVPLRPLHALRVRPTRGARVLRSRRGQGLRDRRAAFTRRSELPINTNGGLLGEAYIHGMNGITEGVRQVRGTSYNQVDDVEHVLVTSGTGVPTSALILAPARVTRTAVTAETTATDTRELIIESAMACFGRQGLDKTTVVDIARAADVSRSTVYEYFRDKAEIVEACAEHSSQRFYREMAKAMGNGESLEDKLALAAVFVTRARRIHRARNIFRRRRSEPAAHQERRGAAARVHRVSRAVSRGGEAHRRGAQGPRRRCGRRVVRANALLVVQHTVVNTGHGRRRRRRGLRAIACRSRVRE